MNSFMIRSYLLKKMIFFFIKISTWAFKSEILSFKVLVPLIGNWYGALGILEGDKRRFFTSI